MDCAADQPQQVPKIVMSLQMTDFMGQYLNGFIWLCRQRQRDIWPEYTYQAGAGQRICKIYRNRTNAPRGAHCVILFLQFSGNGFNSPNLHLPAKYQIGNRKPQDDQRSSQQIQLHQIAGSNPVFHSPRSAADSFCQRVISTQGTAHPVISVAESIRQPDLDLSCYRANPSVQKICRTYFANPRIRQ